MAGEAFSHEWGFFRAALAIVETARPQVVNGGRHAPKLRGQVLLRFGGCFDYRDLFRVQKIVWIMGPFIGEILLIGAPGQIFQAVVYGVPVQMATLSSSRAGAHESLEHEAVNVKVELFTLAVQPHPHIVGPAGALFPDVKFQNATRVTGSNLPKRRGFVRPARDRFPGFHCGSPYWYIQYSERLPFVKF